LQASCRTKRRGFEQSERSAPHLDGALAMRRCSSAARAVLHLIARRILFIVLAGRGAATRFVSTR
jgi:hypothetical protein